MVMKSDKSAEGGCIGGGEDRSRRTTISGSTLRRKGLDWGGGAALKFERFRKRLKEKF